MSNILYCYNTITGEIEEFTILEETKDCYKAKIFCSNYIIDKRNIHEGTRKFYTNKNELKKHEIDRITSEITYLNDKIALNKKFIEKLKNI